MSSGLLVLQSYGTSGITNYLKQQIQTLLKRIDEDYYVEIKPTTQKEYVKKLFKHAKITDICLETYKKEVGHTDLTGINEKMLFTSAVCEKHYKKPIIKDKNKFLNIFLNQERLNTSDFATLTSDEEEISNLKVNCSFNGKNKVINYNAFFNMRITEDITNLVTINPITGQPSRESLFSIMDAESLWYLCIMKILVNFNDEEIEFDEKNINCVYDKLFTTEESDDKTEVFEKINEKNIALSIK